MNGSIFLEKLVFVWVYFQILRRHIPTKTKFEYPRECNIIKMCYSEKYGVNRCAKFAYTPVSSWDIVWFSTLSFCTNWGQRRVVWWDIEMLRDLTLFLLFLIQLVATELYAHQILHVCLCCIADLSQEHDDLWGFNEAVTQRMIRIAYLWKFVESLIIIMIQMMIII